MKVVALLTIIMLAPMSSQMHPVHTNLKAVPLLKGLTKNTTAAVGTIKGLLTRHPSSTGKNLINLSDYIISISEEDFLHQQNMTSLKFYESLKFFLKHAYRDTKRRKCHFCLALCSVFIVVLFSLVINTIVARGPIIFLKMAEAN